MDNVAEIERRIDRAVTATIPVSTPLGGIDPKDYGQVMEFAKTMATAKAGIPQWLRGSAGDCLMICSRAMRWRMDPYFVAEKSYLMVNPRTQETRVGWESQLVHAVVEALAPLKSRLRHEIKGEGDNRYCEVWGTFKGEDSPHRFKSETLAKRIKDIGKSDRGNFRGSPLWLTKPEVQLFYDASRDWARINCPDVLAGVYTPDELLDMEAVDVTPTTNKVTELSNRLRDASKAHAGGGRGFDADHVNRETSARSSIIEGEVNSDPNNGDEDVERGDESGVGERSADSADRREHAGDEVAGAGVRGGPDEGGGANARSQAATVEGEGEVGASGSQPKPKGKGKR
jgi:hypothetical protein